MTLCRKRANPDARLHRAYLDLVIAPDRSGRYAALYRMLSVTASRPSWERTQFDSERLARCRATWS